MDRKLERLILDLLRRHNLLRLATVRPDGWPQVTTVTYANEGLTLYVMVDKTSQKAKNIRKCDKVSLTIDRDTPDWDRIKGLSMGATAQILADRKQKAYGAALLAKKFPDMAQWASHAATRTSGYAQSGSCCAWAPRKRPAGAREVAFSTAC